MAIKEEAHPQSPSARWAKFQADVREQALRSATERSDTDRKRTHETEYHRATEGLEGTG